MLRFTERVDDGDELSCDSDDDDFVRFSCISRAVSECLENWIVVAGNESALEHHKS